MRVLDRITCRIFYLPILQLFRAHDTCLCFHLLTASRACWWLSHRHRHNPPRIFRILHTIALWFLSEWLGEFFFFDLHLQRHRWNGLSQMEDLIGRWTAVHLVDLLWFVGHGVIQCTFCLCCVIQGKVRLKNLRNTLIEVLFTDFLPKFVVGLIHHVAAISLIGRARNIFEHLRNSWKKRLPILRAL